MYLKAGLLSAFFYVEFARGTAYSPLGLWGHAFLNHQKFTQNGVWKACLRNQTTACGIVREQWSTALLSSLNNTFARGSFLVSKVMIVKWCLEILCKTLCTRTIVGMYKMISNAYILYYTCLEAVSSKMLKANPAFFSRENNRVNGGPVGR